MFNTKLVYNKFGEPLLILHRGLDNIILILHEYEAEALYQVFQSLKEKENDE